MGRARVLIAVLGLAGITLAALVLRLVPFFAAYPLHRDEALYGYWARLIASGQDPLLLTSWIDKPPLTLYFIALSFSAFGVSEWTLRLPGMIAGLLLVPATYRLAVAAYDRRTGLLAAALVAASPFAILFAPTAFTDPWLTLWLVVALWAALSRRAFVAGLATGLAIASKQQGVLVVPLVLAALVVPRRGEGASFARATSPLRRLLSAFVGFALVFAPLTYWDSLRWHNRPSFWDRSLTTYAPLSLAPFATWDERAADWAHQFGYLFGHPVITAAVVALALYGVVHQRRALDLLLAAFVAAYLFLHVAISFQPWDRYLLPLVPLVCVLAARGLILLDRQGSTLSGGGTKCRRSLGACSSLLEAAVFDYGGQKAPASGQDAYGARGCAVRATLTLLVAVTVSVAAWLGMAGRLPVGSDHGAYRGLDRGIAFITSRPANAIIYHHSLGWQYDFYLFGAPQERRWYGTAWKLADDAAATHGREQWLLLPEWEMDWLDGFRLALAGHGLALAEAERIYRADGSRSFVLYRIDSRHGLE